ncbi:MAG: hypothetical protein C0502_05260 [Opitutus sp.]|nr:hypothetical protein [Opitutus sp.]
MLISPKRLGFTRAAARALGLISNNDLVALPRSCGFAQGAVRGSQRAGEEARAGARFRAACA